MYLLVVAYDIADDNRRERVATILSGYGPRVQLSVFECEVPTRKAIRELRTQVRDAVDVEEDQVRFYEVPKETQAHTYIVGAREIEERKDFWLVR